MSGQNTSSAVMQQRHEPSDGLDDFPTPPWATRALLERILCPHYHLFATSCREPAVNRGHMIEPLSKYFTRIIASDIHDYGCGFPVRDFLDDEPLEMVDWTITNPPFRLAPQFIDRALETSRQGVAMIARCAFLEGQKRYRDLFQYQPPTDIYQFVERVVMHKGKLAPGGSTATAYCWLVWLKDEHPTHPRFHWIAPCRKRLEREDDYTSEEPELCKI